MDRNLKLDKMKNYFYLLNQVKQEMDKFVIGQELLTEKVLLALLSVCQQNPASESKQRLGGAAHILITGSVGTGKTLLAKVLAGLIGGKHNRVQCTSDQMPSDIIGLMIFDSQNKKIDFKPGPIFCNILLLDEINRAQPKTQSAVLQAMAEGEVTINIPEGETEIALPEPQLTIGTRNPLEHEGVYILPEAQLDRFGVELVMEEVSAGLIVDVVDVNQNFDKKILKPLLSPEKIQEIRHFIHNEIYIAPELKLYISNLTKALTPFPFHDDQKLKEERRKTSEKFIKVWQEIWQTPVNIFGSDKFLPEIIKESFATRSAIFITVLAKSKAFWGKKLYVEPDDVLYFAQDAIRHRLVWQAVMQSLFFNKVGRARFVATDEIFKMVIEKMELP